VGDEVYEFQVWNDADFTRHASENTQAGAQIIHDPQYSPS